MRKPKFSFDLDGNPIKPRSKCKHCGKEDWHHHANTHQCPSGLKHRTLGYIGYAATTFESKQ